MWRKKEARTRDVAHDFYWQKTLFSIYYLLAKLLINFDEINIIKWAEENVWPIKRSED
jgi:hypothetical protein